jgi:hypothetical protein
MTCRSALSVTFPIYFSAELSKLNSKWAARPKADEASQKQRRDLWNALNAFLMQNGAAIVSPKYASPIWIEVGSDSELPARLRELLKI